MSTHEDIDEEFNYFNTLNRFDWLESIERIEVDYLDGGSIRHFAADWSGLYLGTGELLDNVIASIMPAIREETEGVDKVLVIGKCHKFEIEHPDWVYHRLGPFPVLCDILNLPLTGALAVRGIVSYGVVDREVANGLRPVLVP